MFSNAFEIDCFLFSSVQAWDIFNRVEAKHLPSLLVNVATSQTEGIVYEMRELKSIEMEAFLAQSNGEILFTIESAVAVALTLYSPERRDKGGNRDNVILLNTITFNARVNHKGSWKARFVPQNGTCSLVSTNTKLAETTVAPGIVYSKHNRKEHHRSTTLVRIYNETKNLCAQVAASSSQSDFLVDVYSLLGVCHLLGNREHCAAQVASVHLPRRNSDKFCKSSKCSVTLDEDHGRLTGIEGLMYRMADMHYPENLYHYETYANSAHHSTDELSRGSEIVKPNFAISALNMEQILAEALSAIASARAKSLLIVSNIVNGDNFDTAAPLSPKMLNKQYGIASGYLNNVYLEMPTVSIKKVHRDVLILRSEKSKSDPINESTLVVKRVKKTRQTNRQNNRQILNASLAVSGGTGALGMATATWGRTSFANHIYLFSRSGFSNGKTRHALIRTGFTRIEKIDGSILADADIYHDSYKKDMPISMVFMHTSGSQQAATMPHTAPDISRRVHSGKFDSIDKLLCERRPALGANFFSSVSALLGNKKHASYSAANSALDSIANRLRAEGIPCTSTQWGAWGSIGK